MHDSYIGLDITRKLTIPHAAKLPTGTGNATPAVLGHPVDASAVLDEDSVLQEANMLDHANQRKQEAELAAPLINRPVCLAEARMSPLQGKATVQVDLTDEPLAQIDLAELDSASADTSHHAAVLYEGPQEASPPGRPEGHKSAARSQPKQAARFATLSQLKAPVSAKGLSGRHKMRSAQPQQTCLEAGSYSSRQAACADADADIGRQYGPSSPNMTGRPSPQQPHPFEAFRFKLAAKATPIGAKCRSVQG